MAFNAVVCTVIRRVACAVVLLVSVPAMANEAVLRSSVSPEFPNGLHAKYLRYIADKMGTSLTLYPMPFARRIDALKHGNIDIMVGLKHSYRESSFVYIEPAYEALRNTYFVRKQDAGRLKTERDLKALIVGVTIDNPSSMLQLDGLYRATVKVSSIEQKIQLLRMGRIDVFTHFETGARLKIQQLQLDDELVVAPFQPGAIRNYYIGLSSSSVFYKQKAKLEHIVQQGVANGDFAAIRLAHEALISHHPQKPANE